MDTREAISINKNFSPTTKEEGRYWINRGQVIP